MVLRLTATGRHLPYAITVSPTKMWPMNCSLLANGLPSLNGGEDSAAVPPIPANPAYMWGGPPHRHI